MEPIYPFAVTGLLAFAGGVSCWRVEVARPTQQPAWAWSKLGKLYLHIAGLISLAALGASLWFGFVHLSWWIPLIFLFLVFPAINAILSVKVTGDILGAIIFPILSIPSLLWLFASWK